MLDGVYRTGVDGTPEFVDVPAPTDEALQAVLHKIITRTMKRLTRRGMLVEEEGSTHMAEGDSDADEVLASTRHKQSVRTVCVRARLIKRVFEIDMEQCPNCSGEQKVTASILGQPAIEKILVHLGLQRLARRAMNGA